MEANLKQAVAFVLEREGGWNPHEDGGTMRGVTQATYNGYRASNGLPQQSVRRISEGEVFEIYVDGYATPIKFNVLPSGVDLVTFDCSINSGPHEAIILLQRSLGIKQDGVFGYQTLHSIQEADPAEIVDAYCRNRLSFLHRLRNKGRFQAGWTNRVNVVREAGLKLAGAPPIDPTTEIVPMDVAMLNWRTTLLGLLYLVVTQGPSLVGVHVDPTYQQWASGAIIALLGYHAKDGAVTGLPTK